MSKRPTLTTEAGAPVADNQHSQRAGAGGPTLLQDHHLIEKLARFNRERIPERVVHAVGSGAFGRLEVTSPDVPKWTKMKAFAAVGQRTPLYVRFSTVAGSRGSTDTPRDVRGFATKFYTDEGNFDLVGNNMPVFFIQDAIKFPDFVHAVKPEPHNEIPQAASAHDTFWDFIWLSPESTHMIMWLMSDRAIPRSFAMMEGFGVHTFRMVNAEGRSRFVKFHWKPALGVHSLVWDEAQQLGVFTFSERSQFKAVGEANALLDLAAEATPGRAVLSPEEIEALRDLAESIAENINFGGDITGFMRQQLAVLLNLTKGPR